MDVELRGAGGRMVVSHSVWGMVRELGLRYGWEPAGTRDPHPERAEAEGEWEGLYMVTDGQAVTAADAQAWAGALERALSDASEHEISPA
jgi:hypothetical protein